MNVRLAVDANVLDAIDMLRTQAGEALQRYVALKQEIADLEAMAELRKATGAELTPIKMLRGGESTEPQLKSA